MILQKRNSKKENSWKKEYIIFILESKVFGVADFSVSIFYDYFALKRLKDFKPFKLKPPYKMEVTFKDEERAESASWIPGAKRSGNTSVSFISNDFMEVLKFFKFAREGEGVIIHC
ncbi:MAG: M55 family metallopeptidase [Candidatus Aminicenantes bacterium]|nr:M55 family metallopeptidase [Candidatus Aminicenantes bacterium]